jgi:hypothetical protein
MRSHSVQMYSMVFASFHRLVLKNFRRSWYISTEDLLRTKEAYLARTKSFRLQEATDVELAKMHFVVE